MKKHSGMIVALLAASTTAHAVELPGVLGDNMVLQQRADVRLWGWSKPEDTVEIKVSWNGKKQRVKADSKGNWSFSIPTPEASTETYTITIRDSESSVSLSNILIGEVWFCSGQSNMEMPVEGWPGQPVRDATETILGADPAFPVRHCYVKRSKSFETQDRCDAVWSVNDGPGVAGASAIAYFFAKRLAEVLKVPVGVINASWGGTAIEGWMSKEVLDRDFPGEVDMSAYVSGQWPEENNHTAPASLYNAMLHPVLPFTARGFIWYQGENNVSRPEQYSRLQPAFVRMLRDETGNAEMPFYYTQIAPYSYGNPDGTAAGYFMWMQAQNRKEIPNSAMAATLDTGESDCIHPSDKQTTANRLAGIALMRDYGYEYIDAGTPVAESFCFENGIAKVRFDVGRKGMSPISKDIPGFELAGKDRVFHPATARVDENDCKTIRVKSEAVPEHVAVRYAIRNYSNATLFNCFGVPASPFRSDDW